VIDVRAIAFGLETELEHLDVKFNRERIRKEAFVNSGPTPKTKGSELPRSVDMVCDSCLIGPLREVAWMLRRYQNNLMNSFRMPVPERYCGRAYQHG